MLVINNLTNLIKKYLQTVVHIWSLPLSSCGDQSSDGLWWPVFIDYGDINFIKANYCGDAIKVTRKNTDVPSVMVASFASYDKALAFAKIVHGEVGEPTSH